MMYENGNTSERASSRSPPPSSKHYRRIIRRDLSLGSRLFSDFVPRRPPPTRLPRQGRQREIELARGVESAARGHVARADVRRQHGSMPRSRSHADGAGLRIWQLPGEPRIESGMKSRIARFRSHRVRLSTALYRAKFQRSHSSVDQGTLLLNMQHIRSCRRCVRVR